MKNIQKYKWPVLALATILLFVVMALGFQIGKATSKWILSCGIWLIAAGLWLMLWQKLSPRKKAEEKPASLLSGIPQEVTKKVKSTRPKVFKKQMRDLENQAVRMKKKTQQIDQALLSYFGNSRISYQKYAAAVAGVIEVYDRRVSRILSQIDIFDEDGYEHLFKTHQEYTDAIRPYRKTFDEIDEELAANEAILDQMDRLLREVSQLNRPDEDLSSLPAMQELSRLTDQTKLYEQNQQAHR